LPYVSRALPSRCDNCHTDAKNTGTFYRHIPEADSCEAAPWVVRDSKAGKIYWTRDPKTAEYIALYKK
jgi:hypothetical protein